MKRYQECNILIRLYRRLKYQPYYLLVAIKGFIMQVLTKRIRAGDEIFYPRDVFKIVHAQWQIKANWLYDWDEFSAELDEELECE